MATLNKCRSSFSALFPLKRPLFQEVYAFEKALKILSEGPFALFAEWSMRKRKSGSFLYFIHNCQRRDKFDLQTPEKN